MPQGTVLGPLLFLMFINDLPDTVTSNITLFADDCIIYHTVKSIQDCLLEGTEDMGRDMGHAISP